MAGGELLYVNGRIFDRKLVDSICFLHAPGCYQRFTSIAQFDPQSLFQSGWFIEGLLSQTLIVHRIRTQQIPFIQSIAAAPVLRLTGAIMTIGIATPFTHFGASIGLQPLPKAFFPCLALTLLSRHAVGKALVYSAVQDMAFAGLDS